MAGLQLQDALQDAAAASASDMEMDMDTDMDMDMDMADMDPSALASPSSSTGSHPSFCDPSSTEGAPADTMREAIRGMESELVDLVFDSSTGERSPAARLADWLKVPLERATASGNLAVVKRLLDAGVGTNPPSNGMRLGLLLHTAAGSGNAGVVEAILKCGADVRGMDKDLHNWTALHVAAAAGHDAAVRAIASAPLADVNVADTRGWTPLHVAANAGHRGVVVFLLLKGATALRMSVPEGDSPLHLAATNNHAGVIEDLLTLGNASVGSCNNAGRTALHLAARLHRLEACIALLRGGATIGRVCSQGLSCLDAAASSGYSGQLLQILTAGESPSDRRRRCSLALYYAAKANNVDTIRELVALGANIDTKRSGGNTNLHCTATRGADRATEALLLSGADLETRNNDGATALHRACSFSQSSTVQLLLRWGADETATTTDNVTAYELVGSSIEEELLSPEAVVSKVQLDAAIRSMLVNAPADRTWRRRGWIVLCRARWLARIAEKARRVRLPVIALSTGGFRRSSGGADRNGGAPYGKTTANKKRKGKRGDRGGGGGGRGVGAGVEVGGGVGGGAGGGSAALASKAILSSSGGNVGNNKGKGQAVPREKGYVGNRSKTTNPNVFNVSGSSGGGGGGGGGKRADSKNVQIGERTRTAKLTLLCDVASFRSSSRSGGSEAAEAAAVLAAFSTTQRPQLRLGRDSVLSEDAPVPGVTVADKENEKEKKEQEKLGAKGKSGFVAAVERLLLVREEGVFREIVSFL